MNTSLSSARKVEILFVWGQLEGISTSYASIAKDATTSASIRKLHRGENQNPGLQLLLTLAEHFGIHLDYFESQSEEECWAYLESVSKTNKPGGGLSNLSPTNKRFVEYVSNLLTVKLLGLQPGQEDSSNTLRSEPKIDKMNT